MSILDSHVSVCISVCVTVYILVTWWDSTAPLLYITQWWMNMHLILKSPIGKKITYQTNSIFKSLWGVLDSTWKYKHLSTKTFYRFTICKRQKVRKSPCQKPYVATLTCHYLSFFDNDILWFPFFYDLQTHVTFVHVEELEIEIENIKLARGPESASKLWLPWNAQRYPFIMVLWHFSCNTMQWSGKRNYFLTNCDERQSYTD